MKILKDILETPKINTWWINNIRNKKTFMGLTVVWEINNKKKKSKVSSIKRLFENINYGSYPQNYYFDDLPIGYKQRLFT